MRLLSIAASLLALVPCAAFAQSITPTSHTDTVQVSETDSVVLTVSTPDTGPATDLIDVVFLADNTGSMGSVISAVESSAASLLAALAGSGADIQFAVTSYFYDPSEGSFVLPGNSGSNNSSAAYNVIQPMTSDLTAVETGITAWFASGGGDGPEGGIYALQQIATDGADSAGGVGSGLSVGFRPGASKIVVWFGDINNHTETVDVPEAIAALTDAGITVIAISTGSGAGLNSGCCGEAAGQATAIATATGGIDTSIGSDSSAIVDAILDTITDVSSTIDLELVLSETFPGLDVTVTCIDALGCDDVGAGESRDFLLSYTGISVGTYVFTATATGLAGVMSDITIHVVDTDAVPLPAAALFMGTGLVGLFGRKVLKRKA